MDIGCVCPNLIHINKIYNFFKIDFKSDYVYNDQSKNLWEMVFVIKGNVDVTLDGSDYSLKQNQAVIFCPDETKKIWANSSLETEAIIISFSADVFPEKKGRIFNLNLLQLEEIQALHDMSLRCFNRNGINTFSQNNDTDILTQELWLRLELLIFSIFSKSHTKNNFPHIKGGKSAEIYRGAVKLMEENPDAGYSVYDIASAFSISSAYLKKIFLKYADCGVMQYYNRLRVRIASEYLLCGKSVKETSEFIGFSDQNYFSTFFKRITGKSPTEFKKQQ